jgi:murein L,D-transpeptidase YafK
VARRGGWRGARQLLLLALLLLCALWLWQAYGPRPGLPPVTGTVDRIVVDKAARQMTLFQGDVAVRRYRIALGFAPEGDKDREGDGRTPEGTFRIDRKNPNSAFHLSLGLDYPHPEDRVRAAAGGYSPGGDNMIHGQPTAVPGGMYLPYDWTAGCIAVTDAEIEEIWRLVALGTEVEIRP